MKKDNCMMIAIVVIAIPLIFLFSHSETEKLSMEGFVLSVAIVAAVNGYLFVRKKLWEQRRFVLLCSCMGIFTAILIMCAEKLKLHTDEYADIVLLEGVLLFFAVFAWCIFCIWVEKGITENVILLILFGGFLIRVFYAVLTNSFFFQNDTCAFVENDYGHMGYVYYIYANGRLPNLDPTCHFQYYQPPLHHAIFALFAKLFEIVGFEQQEMRELLQIPAVVYGTLTLFFINKIGVRLKLSVSGRAIGLGFVTFLPYSIIFGGALNNDSLMTLLMVMALYFTLVWYENPGYKEIILMAICIGCSMMTKLSGVLAAPAMAVLMLQKAWQERVRVKEFVKQFLCFGVIAFPLGLWYSVLHYVQYGMPFGFVPRISEESEQFIGTHAKWSRFFDFGNAFKSLAIRWGGESTDYNIPIALVKFAVFAEGDFYELTPTLLVVGSAMFWVVLTMGILAVIAFVYWILQKENTIMEKVFVTAILTVPLLSYFKFCLSYRFVCTMNIRYILVVVYFAFMILGTVLAGIIQKLGQKSSRILKIAATPVLGFVSAYIAAVVVLIVQMDQVIP